ncbi:histidine-rich protein [Nocardia goodfellowii]
MTTTGNHISHGAHADHTAHVRHAEHGEAAVDAAYEAHAGHGGSAAHAAHELPAGHDSHAGHGPAATHAAHQAPAEHDPHAGNRHAATHATHEAHDAHAGHGPVEGHDAHAGHGGGLPGGLQIAQDGYTLELSEPIGAPGEIDFRFRILGPDGAPVTEYDDIHDRRLHLIVVRRELTGFWHVHPELTADGTWVVRLNLPDAGAYRVFTDIAPRALGKTITLGADLALAGAYLPQPTPQAVRTATVDDYEVTLDGDLVAGGGRLLTLTVHKDGQPVTDLQPYLAAFGHLVVIRAGDLAYVHVHPNGAPGDGVTAPGPQVTFHTAVPGPGTYRLFLDFKHGEVVRTAAFTLRA